MKCIVFFIHLFTWLLICTNVTFAKSGNGWVSSGGDNLPMSYGASWFNHSAGNISYCLVIDKNYSFKEEQLKTMIDRSINSWKNYYLNKTKIGNNYAINGKIPNFNYIYESKCSNKTRITFYFNIQNEITNSNKARYQNPYSFAAFNNDLQVGYFWFSELKDKIKDQMINDHALEILIMHELGHAFGIPHVESTIMKEDIAKTITSLSVDTSIDQKGKILFSTRENFEISGNIPNNFGINNTQAFLFEKFTGRKPVGNISAKLINRHEKQFDSKPAFQMFFSDDIGNYQLNLDSKKLISIENFSKKVFLTYSENKVNNTEMVNFQTSATWILHGEIVDSTGIKYQAIFDINNTTAGLAPFTVRVINNSDNTMQTIFSNGN